MGSGGAVAPGRSLGQKRWQNSTATRRKDVQTWSQGHVRLLHAARAVCSRIPGGQENQAPFLPFISTKDQLINKQAGAKEFLYATFERTVLPC